MCVLYIFSLALYLYILYSYISVSIYIIFVYIVFVYALLRILKVKKNCSRRPSVYSGPGTKSKLPYG